MDRRSFLHTSAACVAAAGLSSLPVVSSCSSGKPAGPELKLSFQDGTTPFKDLNEKLDFQEKLGVVGFEPHGKGLAEKVNTLQQALRGRNVKVSAICAGFDGFILAEDPAVKASFDSSMRDIVAAAGELGSTGVIMVPVFNRQKPCLPHTRETREFLVQQLKELGEYALKCGTTVILEPLNRREAHYLRLVSDAAAICRDTECEGVKCMGDFWHMQEETSDYAAFLSAGKEYLRHVHMAGRLDRKMPGEAPEKDIYVQGFRALKEIGYDYYVSFECGSKGDKLVTLPAAVELLRKQWSKA